MIYFMMNLAQLQSVLPGYAIGQSFSDAQSVVPQGESADGWRLNCQKSESEIEKKGGNKSTKQTEIVCSPQKRKGDKFVQSAEKSIFGRPTEEYLYFKTMKIYKIVMVYRDEEGRVIKSVVYQ